MFVIYMFKQGVFSSTKSFENYISSFGIWEVAIFIVIQIIQVVIPILPSTIGSVVCIILFGPIYGFIYNYCAICIGSSINFLLSKKYGTELVKKMVGNTKLEKYLNSINNQKKFDKIFTAAIFLPGAPDDYLCYIAGLTKMRFRYFISIILLGKPLSIAIYSIGITVIFNYIKSLF